MSKFAQKKELNRIQLPFFFLLFLLCNYSLPGYADYSYDYGQYSNDCRPNCQPSSCCENSSGRFFVRGDLLYWKPQVSNLELDSGTASINQVTVGGVQVTSTCETDLDPHFKWDAGYRVGAGYQFGCSEWEIGAIWTHFQDSGTRETGFENITEARLKFNQIDLVFAYNSPSCTCFSFKPFIGARYAKIHTGIEAQLITDITLSSVPVSEIRTFDDKDHFRGAGPLLGLQANWDVGCGFGVYGTAAASLLYGFHKVSFNDSDTFTAPLSREIFNCNTKSLHRFNGNIDLALGLSWTTCICNSYELNMKLGFEHHQYFDQSHLGVSPGDLSLSGGVFSAELAF